MIAGRVTALVGDAFLPGEPGDAWEGVAETPALILLSLQITEEGEQWGIPCLSFPRQGANSAARPLAGFLPTPGGDMVGREQSIPLALRRGFPFPTRHTCAGAGQSSSQNLDTAELLMRS